MNIKILDSWLREYLKTKAKPKVIAEKLSLTSVSVERLERVSYTSQVAGLNKAKTMTPGMVDYIYDIEITTNRPDLMSIVGLARETAAVLPQFGIQAEFIEPKLDTLYKKPKENLPLEIKNDPSLVNRILAIAMEVDIKQSPELIKERLEAGGIRSLNNIVDITNYVMREIGYPTHVFDYDRLKTGKIIIREAKKGEKTQTLDRKTHTFQGGEIIAENGTGEIIDLIAIMGLQNSVVTDNTKRIVFFINNAKPYRVRKTSMSLGIRTEAAILNEKEIDPELAYKALIRGLQLFKQIANAKLLSDIIDIYPNKQKAKEVTVSLEKINKVIGIKIPSKLSVDILTKLGFKTKIVKDIISVMVPTWRIGDVRIEEDIIEEIARAYGYHKLPSIIPPLTNTEIYHLPEDPFYWEKRIKNALKYWGFTEVYTYSMVSETMLDGPTEEAISLANPLSEDMVYLRKTLTPNLLQAQKDNKNREEMKIFELSNVYIPRKNNLPEEILMLAGVIKKENISFYEVKGIIEQLLSDLGIKNIKFKEKENGGSGTSIYIENGHLGEIEVLEADIADFELNFDLIRKYASPGKIYKPIQKFPPIIEDIRIEVNPNITYEKILSVIKKQSPLIADISLLDIYENKRTFRIRYQSAERNLTNEEIALIREKIHQSLQKELSINIV